MTQMNFVKKAVLLSGVAVISFAAQAQAGFEWKGPVEAPAAAASAPADEGAPADQATPDMAPVAAAPADSGMTPLPQATAPVQQATAPAAQMAAPVDATPMAAAAPAGDALTGFGSDLPLVMALQQIVPPGYQYSFASGVNPGVSVSWEGGKAWQDVLTDTLSKQGLSYRVQNNTVVVGFFQSGDAAPVTQQAAAAAPQASAPIVSQPPAADDMAPVAIATQPAAADAAPAPVTSSAADAAPKEGVNIHRQKHSTLLEKLGWAKGSNDKTTAPTDNTDNVAVQNTAPDAAAPAPAPVKTASAAMNSSAYDAGSAAAPAPAAVAPAAAAGSWAGTKGQTLRDVLKAWADKAGVELYWSIDYDYRLSDNVGYTGSFDEAVGGLLDKFASVRPQPYGQLHQSAAGPRVSVVKSYDLTR